MTKQKQLVKNTIIVAVGKICTQFISFFLLPLYTALLSTEEYGTVDLLNTYISLILPIFFLQMDQAIFRFLIDIREKEEEKKRVISSAIYTVSIQAVLYLVLCVVLSCFINNKFKYFLATNVIAAMFSNILLQISRGLGDNTTYSIGSLISGASTVILNVLFIAVFKWGAYGMLTATLIGNILCCMFIFFRKKIYAYLSTKKYSKSEVKKLWKYSIPLVPNQLSWWIVNVSDRLIITYILDVGFNGIYSAANKFSSVCITVFNIFNLTWAESASMYIKDKDSSKYFSDIMNSAIKLFSSFCLGIIAFMPFVFNLFITGDGFKSAYYQIPVLMISTIFTVSVSLLGSIYVALKKTKEIAKTSIYAAIINIIINFSLIRFIGLYAASISTLIAYFTMAVYRYIDIQKYIKIKIEKKTIVTLLIMGTIIITIYYIKNIYLCVLGAILSVIFAFLYNKKIIESIVEFVKNKYMKLGVKHV